MGCSSSKQIEEPSSSCDRRPNRPKAPPPKLKREEAFNQILSTDGDYDYTQPVPKFSRSNVGDNHRTPSGGGPSSARSSRGQSDERPTPTWDKALAGIVGRGDERRLDSDAIRRSAQESLSNPEFMRRNLSSFANLGSANGEMFERRRARRREEEGKMTRGLMLM
ncbi:hypothetical protein GE09DRAFT_111784 [Coniochaeta sp. 2T2.1]|nr:hypothetical protein GE09DRAFT_111784 [Coniochaeta sp. 2T2.1]